MQVLLLLLVLCQTTLIVHSLDCENIAKSNNVETQLRQKLFCDYDKSLRPVSDHNSATTVSLKYIVKGFDYVSRINICKYHFMSKSVFEKA